jgi:hypothetical protein
MLSRRLKNRGERVVVQTAGSRFRDGSLSRAEVAAKKTLAGPCTGFWLICLVLTNHEP